MSFEFTLLDALQALRCPVLDALAVFFDQAGAHAYTRTAHGFAPCRKVRAVDTTGAGDGFIGSFLWQLERDGVTRNKLEKLSRARLCEYLAFSNQFCGISVQQHGAIDSYPTLDQMQ